MWPGFNSSCMVLCFLQDTRRKISFFIIASTERMFLLCFGLGFLVGGVMGSGCLLYYLFNETGL